MNSMDKVHITIMSWIVTEKYLNVGDILVNLERMQEMD